MSKKRRLDKFLFDIGLVESREKARGLILAGEVIVNEARCDKPGTPVCENDEIRLKARLPYVSRGALKLESVASEFGFEIDDKIFLDVGSSTGGFTDYLLQHGARFVMAVDVGTAQLHEKLRQCDRVFSLEKTHILHLQAQLLPFEADGVVADLSFISMQRVLPVLASFCKDRHYLCVLIKPQFEVGKDKVGKGGVVKDQSLILSVLLQRLSELIELGYEVHDLKPSLVAGPKGNREFFIYASKGNPKYSEKQLVSSESELEKYIQSQIQRAFG